MQDGIVGHIKGNGKCSVCNTQLVVKKTNHTVFRTKGYEKYFESGERIIKCPTCKNEQLVG